MVSVQDYYPFGMPMEGRYGAIGTDGNGNAVITGLASGYRYGFNGKENDNEVKGEGNQVAFEARIYDPRVGRFLSRDPLAQKYPGQSDYAYAANNPVRFIDVLGMRPADPIDNLSVWMRFRYYAYKATEFVVDGRATAWTDVGRRNQSALVNYTMPIALGAGNGAVRTLSLNTINLSASNIGLGPEHEETYDRSSYAGAAVPNPLSLFNGGAGPSASFAFAGGIQFAASNIFSLEAKMAAFVFSSTAPDADGKGPYVYRGLSDDDVASTSAGKGIIARDPDAHTSILSHVAGKKLSRWISTSLDENVAKEKYGKNGYVKIDLSEVKSVVAWINKGLINGGKRFNAYAKKDQEVLIEKIIPQKAIIKK